MLACRCQHYACSKTFMSNSFEFIVQMKFDLQYFGLTLWKDKHMNQIAGQWDLIYRLNKYGRIGTFWTKCI